MILVPMHNKGFRKTKSFLLLFLILSMVFGSTACVSSSNNTSAAVSDIPRFVVCLTDSDEPVVDESSDTSNVGNAGTNPEYAGEDPLATYQDVTYQELVDGDYAGQNVCIEGIVDFVSVTYDASDETYEGQYIIWYHYEDTYVYEEGVLADVTEELYAYLVLCNAQNGDVIRYATTVYDDGSFGTTKIAAVESIDSVGSDTLEEIYDTFKNGCDPLNYAEAVSDPTSYAGTICKVTGIVEESSLNGYLLDTEDGYVYLPYRANYDELELTVGEEITVYGQTTYMLADYREVAG